MVPEPIHPHQCGNHHKIAVEWNRIRRADHNRQRLSGGQYNTDVVDSSGNIYIADYNNGNM